MFSQVFVCPREEGYPLVSGPCSFLGVPPCLWYLGLWGGIPVRPVAGVTPLGQDSPEMCGAGGMPLAFPQEDTFLFLNPNHS